MKKLFFVLLVIAAFIGCEKEFEGHPIVGEWVLEDTIVENGEKVLWALKVDDKYEIVNGKKQIEPGYVYILLYDKLSDKCNRYLSLGSGVFHITRTLVIDDCNFDYTQCEVFDIDDFGKGECCESFKQYNYLEHPILGEFSTINTDGNDTFYIGKKDVNKFIPKYKFIRVK